MREFFIVKLLNLKLKKDEEIALVYTTLIRYVHIFAEYVKKWFPSIVDHL